MAVSAQEVRFKFQPIYDNHAGIIKMLRVGFTRGAACKNFRIKPWLLAELCAAVEGEVAGAGAKAQEVYRDILQAESDAQVLLEKTIIDDALGTKTGTPNIRTAMWLVARRFGMREKEHPPEHIQISLWEEELKKVQKENEIRSLRCRHLAAAVDKLEATPGGTTLDQVLAALKDDENRPLLVDAVN
jgi:hypothetical protein